MRYVFICLFLVGCATEFKGGATPDHRPRYPETDIKGAVKTPCQVSSIRKQGKDIYLDC